jgi:hypothetical protein
MRQARAIRPVPHLMALEKASPPNGNPRLKLEIDSAIDRLKKELASK